MANDDQHNCLDNLNFFFFGDDITDIYQIETSNPDTRSIKHRCSENQILGGTGLLAQMIGFSISTYNLTKISSRFKQPAQDICAINCLKRYHLEKGMPPTTKKDTFRVEHFLGFRINNAAKSKKELCFFIEKGIVKFPEKKTKFPEFNFLIINDEGIFEDCSDEDFCDMVVNNIHKHTIVIYKMNPCKYRKSFWQKIKDQKKLQNVILFVNIEALRDVGASIPQSLSWDSTVEMFKQVLPGNQKLSLLKESAIVIVKINNEGAIVSLNNSESDTWIYFSRTQLEGDFAENYDGFMPSSANAFIAGFIQGILTGPSANIETLNISNLSKNPESLEQGISKGLHASRKLLHYGINNGEKPQYPLNKIFKENNKSLVIKKQFHQTHWKSFIEEEFVDPESTFAVAKVIITKGIENVEDLNVPIYQYGDLKCINRSEIESYQTIRNLIKEYVQNLSFSKPLSIAVFGPPGSGKSFGINEVVKSISDKKITSFTFNLSQFNSYADLVQTFHKIRDHVLAGELPLVFYDEFDCLFNEQKLGWIKYFLQPMQDGCFSGDQALHPLGRCILVFAGGTYPSFEKFSEVLNTKDQNLSEKAKDLKLGDFVSRLKGYLNVIGIDPEKPEQTNTDYSYMLRRAVIFRSILKKAAPQLFDIDDMVIIEDNVLNAFLKVNKYKHGVRSLQAIIEMSLLNEKKSFGSSSLPSEEQLKIHVDPEKFMPLINGDLNTISTAS